jgi:cytochrome c556
MIRSFGAVVALFATLGAGVAFAQGDVIAQRKALMKAVGDGNRGPAAILRGEQPFSLAVVQAALKNIETAGRESLKLYPDNSRTGGDTAALPKIWETKADFDAKLLKLEADAKAAMVKITDEASFKSEFPALLKNCAACHTDYRARR